MKRLVRLYPRAWRARYEEETVTLLDQQHASLKGSVDLVRGAVDAHRHPHFVTGRRPSYSGPFCQDTEAVGKTQSADASPFIESSPAVAADRVPKYSVAGVW